MHYRDFPFGMRAILAALVLLVGVNLLMFVATIPGMVDRAR
jgi:hypothetical protein